MKTYKKKIMLPDTDIYKMVTIYEIIGKFGTHGTNIFYLLDKPEVGKNIYGSCDELNCNPNLYNFKFTDWKRFLIWDYDAERDYWYISY